MTAQTSNVFWGTTIITGLALLSALAPAFFTYAAERDTASRERDSRSTTSVPAPTLAPTLPPPPKSGGIVSSTEGTVDTGGNEGGAVVTGPEHVEVIEINIGPSNPPPPPPQEETSPPTEEPDCTSGRRDCRDTGRGR